MSVASANILLELAHCQNLQNDFCFFYLCHVRHYHLILAIEMESDVTLHSLILKLKQRYLSSNFCHKYKYGHCQEVLQLLLFVWIGSPPCILLRLDVLIC